WPLPAMVSLAQTLALLAMAASTVAKDVNLDMALDSFDDQYLSCGANMTQMLPELLDSDFAKNKEFKKAWDIAKTKWQKWGFDSSPLSPDQAVALMVYTTSGMELYKRFNRAVSQAGSSSEEYRNNFHFKSLHFLLTQALQKLSKPRQCHDVFRRVRDTIFKAQKGTKVRFGQFASTSRSAAVALGFGQDTMFTVRTCHGADIQRFSHFLGEEEVLIPPFEIFEVLEAREEGNMMRIKLRSTG
ncbi:NRT2 ribosyltransferase, partial [Alaudala cheleensis]|nr:NRT2 ribosyltransferase [Alaudala cheleensis]